MKPFHADVAADLQTNTEYGARSFIWGTADAGEKVTVSRNPGHDQYVVNADKQGK